jgi:hypothetical protein
VTQAQRDPVSESEGGRDDASRRRRLLWIVLAAVGIFILAVLLALMSLIGA